MKSKIKEQCGAVLSFAGIVATMFAASGLENEISTTTLGILGFSILTMAVGVLMMNDEI